MEDTTRNKFSGLVRVSRTDRMEPSYFGDDLATQGGGGDTCSPQNERKKEEKEKEEDRDDDDVHIPLRISRNFFYTKGSLDVYSTTFQSKQCCEEEEQEEDLDDTYPKTFSSSSSPSEGIPLGLFSELWSTCQKKMSGKDRIYFASLLISLHGLDGYNHMAEKQLEVVNMLLEFLRDIRPSKLSS